MPVPEPMLNIGIGQKYRQLFIENFIVPVHFENARDRTRGQPNISDGQLISMYQHQIQSINKEFNPLISALQHVT